MSLENYYKMNFSLQQYHKWDMQMVENWIPYERELYVALLAQHIEDENKKNVQP